VQTRTSASIILKILFEYVEPHSVLDIGCGLGTWLAVAQELGIAEIRGVEGSWLDRTRLAIDPSLVDLRDVEQGISLKRQFDLVICLEVAEHLFEAAADTLVTSLVEHGDLILFSAAIPYQGGHHHVNEQFPQYWADRFARHGFHPLDFIRPRIWTDASVLWFLRQNTLLFAHERVLASNEKLQQEHAVVRPLSVVHPDVYMSRLQQVQNTLQEHQKLIQMLSQGGTFSVTRLVDGRLNISRVAGTQG